MTQKARRALCTLLYSMSVFFAVSLADPAKGYAQTCDECQTKYRPACGKNCEGQKNSKAFDSCSDTCVQTVCKKFCTDTQFSESARSGDPEFKCKACLQKAQSGPCVEQCDPGSPRFKVCLNRCAKQTCEAKCETPLSSDTGERGKYDCQFCKEKNRAACAQNPDCPTGPGRIACQVACEQSSCQSECGGD